MSASQDQPKPLKNRLLATLPTQEQERLQPHLQLVPLEYRQILYRPNEPIDYIYFPNYGVVSLLNLMENGDAVEVGTVGNEGMVGLPVFLGANTIPGEAFAQVPGEAFRMRADVFQREVTPGSPVHALLLRYTQALINQIAQSSACNRLHSIEERFCRWMLMTQDRVGSNQFPLTQEFIAQMLGVRRASVSVVAAIIQKAGLISYKRGKMTIVDREGLQGATCECYAIIKQEFDRLLGGSSIY
ncbi:Crp/Fnr family transcriptional regulator [Scytonema sp. HK-05]|uniref:Crp/Fnr family transcriptional regulator n=1 Tax=Scytonema sp. HK-05 TaxID=1137095 RepID=UPI000935C55D|nr:Crp/Fnr family transcriptional regulator [Scytonema sp. HK-05]OKH45793.1 Crp/Fnr family transcriptional regulator [Scytonema sp. HK-05]BAY44869.1 Crp/Fnr family transcriptional regulator [Scytonema sp. HK-05]